MAEPGVRILSFDGGGIRGLSSLIILREIMARIQEQENLPDMPLPWMYFNMIAGTSTGGLIAIMLGRLRMSVEEAIRCYANLAERVFSETKYFWQDGKFKASNLERIIKEIVQKHSEDKEQDARMIDTRSDGTRCRVFVCTMSAHSMNRPSRFRTYGRLPNQMPNCKIWEAARATSAAPTFFKRAIIDDSGTPTEFVDGGLGCNNPTAELLSEASIAFPERSIACIVSIGTGQAKTIAIPESGVFQNVLPLGVIKALQRMAVDCEATANSVSARFNRYAGVYFRFNVNQGMQDIGLGKWESLKEVTGHTYDYLKLNDVERRRDEAVAALRAGACTVAIAEVAR